MNLISPADAFAAALRGEPCRLVGIGADATELAARRWCADADRSDEMVLGRCWGTTVDIGCGPGRLTHALMTRGVATLGIDVVTDASDRNRIATQIADHELNIERIEREIRDYDAQRRIAAVQKEIDSFGAGGKTSSIERQIRDFDLEGKVRDIERQIDRLDADRRARQLEDRLDAELPRLTSAIAAIR